MDNKKTIMQIIAENRFIHILIFRLHRGWLSLGNGIGVVFVLSVRIDLIVGTLSIGQVVVAGVLGSRYSRRRCVGVSGIDLIVRTGTTGQVVVTPAFCRNLRCIGINIKAFKINHFNSPYFQSLSKSVFSFPLLHFCVLQVQ